MGEGVYSAASFLLFLWLIKFTSDQPLMHSGVLSKSCVTTVLQHTTNLAHLRLIKPCSFTSQEGPSRTELLVPAPAHLATYFYYRQRAWNPKHDVPFRTDACLEPLEVGEGGATIYKMFAGRFGDGQTCKPYATLSISYFPFEGLNHNCFSQVVKHRSLRQLPHHGRLQGTLMPSR